MKAKIDILPENKIYSVYLGLDLLILYIIHLSYELRKTN